jgi:hypothetical protein
VVQQSVIFKLSLHVEVFEELFLELGIEGTPAAFCESLRTDIDELLEHCRNLADSETFKPGGASAFMNEIECLSAKIPIISSRIQVCASFIRSCFPAAVVPEAVDPACAFLPSGMKEI